MFARVMQTVEATRAETSGFAWNRGPIASHDCPATRNSNTRKVGRSRMQSQRELSGMTQHVARFWPLLPCRASRNRSRRKPRARSEPKDHAMDQKSLFICLLRKIPPHPKPAQNQQYRDYERGAIGDVGTKRAFNSTLHKIAGRPKKE